MSKTAVFPASGKLGTSIYTHLLKFVSPKDVILVSRHPENTPSDYTDAGVTTRKADYDSPSTLDNAFDGVANLVLVSYPSIEYEHRFEVHKSAIDAARRSKPGVSHIFYTSLAFGGDCTPDSVAHVMQAHLATEVYLRSLTSSPERPYSYTSIREGLYSESFPMYTGFFDLKSPQSEVRIPHDGSAPGIAWAKIDELGEATAQLIRKYVASPEKSEYKNKIVLLSGPKPWSILETLQEAGKAVGKEVKIKQVKVEEYAKEPLVEESLGAHGPGKVPILWATSFEAVKKGETAVISADMETLLGRKPEDFGKTVRAMAKG